MTKDVEDAAGNLTADFAALRRDVARLTETIGELVQRQTQSVGLRASEAVGEARDRVTNTAAEAQGQLRSASGERRDRGEHRAQSPDSCADRFRRRNVARRFGPITRLSAHDPISDQSPGRCD